MNDIRLKNNWIGTEWSLKFLKTFQSLKVAFQQKVKCGISSWFQNFTNRKKVWYCYIHHNHHCIITDLNILYLCILITLIELDTLILVLCNEGIEIKRVINISWFYLTDTLLKDWDASTHWLITTNRLSSFSIRLWDVLKLIALKIMNSWHHFHFMKI